MSSRAGSAALQRGRPTGLDPRSGRAGSRLLLVAAVLALLGTGILDAVLRAGAAPVARVAASGGLTSAAGLQSAPPGADRQVPTGVPGVRTALPPGPAPLQSLDRPAPAPASPLMPHLLFSQSSLPPTGAVTAGAIVTGDSRAPPHDAGTFASLPSRP